MAQKHRTARRQKSSFPVFDYIDAMMPDKLADRFNDMPHHIRWTIVSAVASLIILWVFMRVVVGSINHYIDTRGPYLQDALRLPYALETRPLPAYPDVIEEVVDIYVLPDTIGAYVLQIPPSAEEVQAVNEAELAAFLALSLPVERSLTALSDSLNERVAAIPVVEEAPPEADAEVAEDGEAAPVIAPTVDPVLLQLTAVDVVLAQLTTLNEALEDDDSISLAVAQARPLHGAINGLIASGVAVPLGVEPLKVRIEELAAIEPPLIYMINDCLVTSMPVLSDNDTRVFPPSCNLTQTALWVERGEYIHSDNGKSIDVTITEFSRPEDAAWGVKQAYYYGRFIAATGDFAMNDVLEYNYFFSFANGLYTLAWSHENWVYSIATDTPIEIDSLMKNFPY